MNDTQKKAHSTFALLWASATTEGAPRVEAAAREWLADELGVEVAEVDFATFDRHRCAKVIELVQQLR